MKLQTQIPLNKATAQIDYSSQLLLLGSCFSENIGGKLNYFKFQNVQNPQGILFQPLAIEKFIAKSVNRDYYAIQDLFYFNDRWHCFDAHSVLSDTSKEVVVKKLNTAIDQTYGQVVKASHVLVTLGTAWVYRHKETQNVVANCHKVPQKNFTKELLDIATVIGSLENMVALVHAINPKAKFVFTVSPVRHLKDGFVENQCSKAHLISAIHSVVQKGKGLYFPSYEIMMDELRDYRFYAEDMVHPSALAIDYIWKKFRDTWIDNDVYDVMAEIEAIQRGLKHRPFNPSGGEHQKFIKSIQGKIAYIKKTYPFMNFNFPEL